MNEIPPGIWRKSSYSGSQGGNCVEVADTPGFSAVRDTQNRQAGHIVAPSAQWAALVAAVKVSAL
ncbi:uncharacterized protein DUF397 [Murinocardiopsis flavida]|uniref:Uncharacterized protein DUF397 n=1 Tax=Murinocardiopsis flavida TaxID=645275 RepID=A0A2P8CY69_9ACTN|nr:DUF397 domain-containing protein [Murinocardiopsis flavida]PSK89924.1 uncharacterized protein DUF397 [Murinocardiopsis flavida]